MNSAIFDISNSVLYSQCFCYILILSLKKKKVHLPKNGLLALKMLIFTINVSMQAYIPLVAHFMSWCI